MSTDPPIHNPQNEASPLKKPWSGQMRIFIKMETLTQSIFTSPEYLLFLSNSRIQDKLRKLPHYFDIDKC